MAKAPVSSRPLLEAGKAPAWLRPIGLSLGGLLALSFSTAVMAEEEAQESGVTEPGVECQGCCCCCCNAPPVRNEQQRKQSRSQRRKTSDAERRGERVSLTVSPLHLVFPILELTGEVRATRHLGAGLILGTGQVDVDTQDPLTGEIETLAVAAGELGGQLTWYPFKPFDGFHIGVEMLYMYLDTDDLVGEVEEAGNRLATGPYLGYKATMKVGVTALVQVGAQYVTARTERIDSQGNTAEESSSVSAPLLNLNVGWSF